MARKVKCYFCKKEIDKDNSYMWIHTTKNDKQYKRYCCSEDEKYQHERDAELYKLCQYETDAILGRPITNNVRNKELKELHEAGHSWEQIYRCIKSKADDIKQMIGYNNIENDYQQIRYMMQVIKNVIYDFAREDEKNNAWVKTEEVEVPIEEFNEVKEETDEEILKRLKNKKENKNSISSFLNNLK